MDSYVFVQLDVPEVISLDGFENHSALLSEAHRFPTHVILAPCEPALKADGAYQIFSDQIPSESGWVLEIAVELESLLPSLDGKSESIIEVADEREINRYLCLSNRMSCIHFQDGPKPYEALWPRRNAWHGTVRIGEDEATAIKGAERQLNTVAAMRFDLSTGDADGVFENVIRSRVETLMFCINRTLLAMRECRQSFFPISRSMQWESVPFVYVLMKGQGNPQGAKLALNSAKLVLRAESISEDNAVRLRAIAAGHEVPSDVDRLIGEARSSWESGEYEFAFLQAVIAAEIATTRGIHDECLRRGVSGKKLKELRKELTYALALNIHLPLCLDAGEGPKIDLITAMNLARSQRNDLMHEGTFTLSGRDVDQLIKDTREYVSTLGAALTAKHTSSN